MAIDTLEHHVRSKIEDYVKHQCCNSEWDRGYLSALVELVQETECVKIDPAILELAHTDSYGSGR